MYDHLTSAELRQLAEITYDAATRLFGMAGTAYTAMGQMPTWTPRYRQAGEHADLTMAAGREIAELNKEILVEIRRRERESAAFRFATGELAREAAGE